MSLIAGFKTSNGDLYRFNQHTGVSQRMQLSPGPDKGKGRPEAACLFIEPYAVGDVVREQKAGRQIVLGHLDRTTKSITGFGDEVEIPFGNKAVVAAIDPKTGNVTKWHEADVLPRIGTTPVERREFQNGTDYVHVGTPISQLYNNSQQFREDVRDGVVSATGTTPISRQVVAQMLTFFPPASRPAPTTQPHTPMHQHTRGRVITPAPGRRP